MDFPLHRRRKHLSYLLRHHRRVTFSLPAACLGLLIGLVFCNTSEAWQAEVPEPPAFDEAVAPDRLPSPDAGEDDETPEALFPTGSEEEADSPETEEKASAFDILGAGGIIGFLIILLSVAAVALMIEHAITIRSKVMIPPELGEEVHDLLKTGQWARAMDRCRSQPSFLGYVLEAAISEIEAGWSSVEKSFEDCLSEQSSRLFRKIEYLSVIGNIAPMLGLLGTVVGMILAFRDLADSDGYSRASDLAEGIYLALITTVEGLIVAIPSLAAFAIFRNRVDALVAEVTFVADRVLRPMKKKLLAVQSETGSVPPQTVLPPQSPQTRRVSSTNPETAPPPRRQENRARPGPKSSDSNAPSPPPSSRKKRPPEPPKGEDR